MLHGIPVFKPSNKSHLPAAELDERIVSLFATGDNGVLLHDSFPMEGCYTSEYKSYLLL